LIGWSSSSTWPPSVQLESGQAVPGVADGGSDLGDGAGETGVDEGQAAGVGAHVGVPDGET